MSNVNSQPSLGYIGMGAMGSQMATRLAATGYNVTVWSRNAAAAEAVAQKGPKRASSAHALASSVDVLLSCVTDDAAVKDLYLGGTNLLAAARPGTTIIEMSTILPSTSREIAAAAKARGLIPLDAPVSGSVTHAGSGQLVIFVGGPRDAYDQHKDIFSCLSRAHFHMGDAGNGSAMKLLVNAMLGTGIQMLAEALVFGQAAGLGRENILTALAETTVVNPSQKAKFENIKAHKYPPTFALKLMAKDFALINQLAAQNRVPIPTLSAAAACSHAALKNMDPNEDYSATIRFVEELAGIKRTT